MAQKNPSISLFEALIPVIILVLLLAFNVYVYGDDALSGSNQFILLIGAAVAAVVGFRIKVALELDRELARPLGQSMWRLMPHDARSMLAAAPRPFPGEGRCWHPHVRSPRPEHRQNLESPHGSHHRLPI